ncbi:hypothetical protein B566_EDAN006591 [Ephemera danica]|nr:hypothetical protein B566_EDAN006591 [Ephemera danica]
MFAYSNVSYKHRMALFAHSKPVDAVGYITSDIINQNRYMLSGVELRLKFLREINSFCLMSYSLVSLKLKINDLAINVRQALKHSTEKYPIVRDDVQIFYFKFKTVHPNVLVINKKGKQILSHPL